MCGLVGIAGNLAYKDEGMMQRLLIFDVFRGKDSTGMASVKMDNTVETVKLSSHPLDLFEMPKFKRLLNGAASKVFLGHNRSATVGAVSSYNAHPFTYDHITGAHNGTLYPECKTALEDAVGERFTVDSQALFAAIAKLGVEEAVSLIREGADAAKGAWSLVWYNSDEDTINFLRNKHRPLWMGFGAEGDRIVWASEWPMMDAAGAMSVTHDYKFLEEGDNKARFFRTSENIHYKFKVNGLLGNVGRPKPVIKEIKGKEPKPVGSSGPPFQMGTPGGGTGSSTARREWPRTGTTSSRSNIGDEAIKTVDIYGNTAHPLGGVISMEDFAMMHGDQGCQWCGKAFLPTVGCEIFEKDGVILCQSCSGHPMVTKIRVRNIAPYIS